MSGNGTVSVSLFRFRDDADISQLQEPLAEVSVTVKAKGWVVISFPDKEPLPAGEYVLAVHDAGNLSLPASGAHESQFVYRNGRLDKSCALRLTAEYAPAPAAGLYGKPTAPAVEDINEYAPHMASALRFDTDKGITNIGGCNALTTSFMEENGVAFTRFKPDTDAGDPYAFINLPSSTVKTDEYKYLLIKVRLDADAPLKGQLYFITDETSIAEPASVHFTYQSTTDWQYVLINLGGNSLYKGLLKTVRYDVFPSVKGTHYADVAYMALFRTKEAAAAFRDNFADYEVEEPEKPTEPTPDYSTYQRADAAAQQHKRRLPHCCGHIHGGIIRIGQQQSALSAACSGLNHIAGELFEQSFRRGNAAGVRRVQVGLVAKIERCFAVLQAAQGVAQQAAGGFVQDQADGVALQQAGGAFSAGHPARPGPGWYPQSHSRHRQSGCAVSAPTFRSIHPPLPGWGLMPARRQGIHHRAPAGAGWGCPRPGRSQ